MNIGTNATLLCICHNKEMLWHKDPRKINGGYWRCRIKHREYDWKRYLKRRKRILLIRKAKLLKELDLVERIRKSTEEANRL